MAKKPRKQLPQGDVDLSKPATKEDIWNGWTNNYHHEGYTIHAVDVRIRDFRALCGVQAQETGMLDMTEPEWSVDCLKCQAKLVKLGLLKASEVDPRALEPRMGSKAWVAKYANRVR